MVKGKPSTIMASVGATPMAGGVPPNNSKSEPVAVDVDVVVVGAAQNQKLILM